jgi:hypothetical protein
VRAEVAAKLVEHVPGLTLDWLYFGRTDALPMALRKGLAAANSAAASLDDPREGLQG